MNCKASGQKNGDIEPETQSRNQHSVEWLAYHDGLTRLPNRRSFESTLHQQIRHANGHNEGFAVLLFDLNRFKAINDTFGHTVGDETLCEITKRLQGVLADNCVMARWAGDEFVVMLPVCSYAQCAMRMAREMQAALRYPITVIDTELIMTVSIGICLYPKHAVDVETLVRNADLALYRAKRAGHSEIRMYSNVMHKHVVHQLQLQNDLHRALERNEFCLYYQPKFRTIDETIVGVEALIRWQHPVRGIVSPDEFIPLAEESGLIIPIGEFVLWEACRQLRQWQLSGLRPLRMAINLSPRQFRLPRLVELVEQVVHDTNVSPESLEFEVTEGITMQLDDSISVLKHFCDMGIRIAIDDFGTGYSSLRYIQKMPLHTLKIDKSFVRNLTKSSNDWIIVNTILSLARDLHLDVVAEGVETQEQFQLLREQRCSEVQGFLFSEPLDAQSFAKLMSSTAVNPRK